MLWSEWISCQYNIKGKIIRQIRGRMVGAWHQDLRLLLTLLFVEIKLSGHHLITLQVLCSFVACLPTTLGISCYSCVDYPGSSEPCSNPSIIPCESYYDSCMAMTVTGKVHGYQYSTTAKNCSISSVCDSNLICDQVNSSISQSNGTMFSCSVNCCDSDLCNGGGELVCS